MSFIPRLHRRSDRNQRQPINESSSAFSPSNFRSPHSEARLSRPPDLPNDVPQSPPPTYNEALCLPPSLIAGRNRQSSSARAVSPVSPIQELASPQLTSDNLSRHDDIGRSNNETYGNLNNRISNISQYPVFLDPSQRFSRRQTFRRPISTASTSTTGILLAMGQLPGSEQFELEPPSQEFLTRYERRPSHPQNPRRDMDEPVVVQTAQAVRVQTVRSSPTASTTSVNRINRISIISTGSTPDLNTQRARSGSNDLHGPRISSLRPARTWPALRSDLVEPASNFRAADADMPPPPPPKDPGYVGRPGPSRLRHCSSTPNLLLPRGQGSTLGFQRDEGRPKNERSGSGKGQHHRSWLGSIGGNRYHRNKSQSQTHNTSPVEDVTPRGHGKRTHHHQSPSNRRSQLVVACARLIGRAMPRVTVHNKGA